MFHNVTTPLARNYLLDAHDETPDRRFVFDRAPMLVYWEATRACDLACLHCRAEAVPRRHPSELQTSEVQALMQQIVQFGGPVLPHLVITGGDPLQRPDLFELIAFGRQLGLNVSVTPAGTKKLTAGVIGRFKEAGVASLALSLDGSDASRHDTFRGVPGSYQWTVDGIRTAVAEGIPVQVNTLVSAETLDDLPAVYAVLKDMAITRWALFFLITTGRGELLAEITPGEGERFLNWLYSLVRESPFPIKTTEAHHFRRIAFLNMRRRGLTAEAIGKSPIGRGFGIRDGNGVVFVSHTGQVYPSGFLPLVAGNVRWQSLVDIYRHSHLFCSLRDVNSLEGKCGYCQFRAICGGSRARAYAATGNPLASDPLCLYQPR